MDASSSRAGACEAVVDDEEWWRICRLADDKGAYMRLHGDYPDLDREGAMIKDRRGLAGLFVVGPSWRVLFGYDL